LIAAVPVGYDLVPRLMLNSNVLVLNHSYLPIHVTSVRRAFCMIYQDVARAVDEAYQTFDFEQWVRLSTHGAETVGTPGGAIRVPRVIALLHFDRVPMRHVRYSRVNVFARDKFTCQYCGARPHRSELNLDHVVPRSMGGKTSWENVVCSCVECNRRKGGRTPEQARLRLLRRPTRPRFSPLANLVTTHACHEQWRPFLRGVDGGQRTLGAAG
jgi:5-methylcytosine-specific restriction endonuclease McrA